MSKKVVILFFISVVSVSVMACDICGSGVGGSYIGILPEFKKRFIGLRYQQNGLISHLGPGGSNSYLTATETFQVMEFWGAVNISKRFRIAGFVPVNFIRRSSQQAVEKEQGLGDITAIGYYQLLNKQQTLRNKLLVQSLWIGTGIKLPVGRFNPEDKNMLQSSQNTFQLGTGSLDFSIHTMYDIRFQNIGINTNLSYKANTRNKYAYRYGNKFTGNVLAYYKISTGKKSGIAPNAGLLFETSAKDWKTRDIHVWETGGRSLMRTVGMELNWEKISIGLNWQAPVYQELGEGKLKAKNRAMIHLSISF